MRYLKTFEQIQDIYPSSQTKYLIVTEDEKWYLKGDAYYNDETDDGYIILYPSTELEEIKTDYFVDDARDTLTILSDTRQVVGKEHWNNSIEQESLSQYGIEEMRQEIIDFQWVNDNDENIERIEKLKKMSDEEIENIFYSEIVTSEDFTRGEAETNGFLYIQKMPLKVISFQFGAIRKGSLNI